MRGRIKDFLVSRTSKQVLMLELDDDFREQFDELADGDVEITVKKWRKKRSLDANAYAWVLIGLLAERLRIPKNNVYRDAIRQIGGVSETVITTEAALPVLKEKWEGHGIGWQIESMPTDEDGFVAAILYYGSSTYDTRQMTLLIDYIIQECEEQGIPTITDEEIEKMLGRWARKDTK